MAVERIEAEPLPERSVDGAAFGTLGGFYDEIERALIPGAKWGRNLDAFNDILRGGFGTPDGGFTLLWKNAHLSQQRLGHEETTCVAQARSEREGPNVFDTLIEILRTHGPGGAESESNVQLRLE